MNLENFITFSKREIDISNISRHDIFLEDIAHALSMICRFNGQIKDFYSVAQHSVMVSIHLEKNKYSPAIQLCGLMHDASEAYMNDIVKPVKILLGDYNIFEKKIQSIIYETFNLSETINQSLHIVKDADKYITFVELNCLLLGNVIEQDCLLLKSRTIFESERVFYARAIDLLNRI